MKKSFLAALLTLILALSCVFGLAACNENGGNDNGNDNDDNNPPAGPQTVEVTGVEVDESTWMLEVGKTKQLTATVSPANATDKSVTWSSDNTDCVTVSQTGLVTAVAVTTSPVEVTVTTANNKTATCLVTVVAAQQSGGEEEGPQEKQPIVLGVGFNQLEVDEEGYTCQLTVDITGNYTFTLNTDAANKFIVTIGTNDPETYENGGVITLPLTKGVLNEFTIAAHEDNKDGNLSLDIVSKTYSLGYGGMIQVSSRVNADAIEAGYIEVDVAVLEAGDYFITGGITGGEVTAVYLNNYPGTCGTSVDGEIDIKLEEIAADDIDENGAIKLKFVFNVTNTAENGFIFWAYVDCDAEEEEEDNYPEITLGVEVTDGEEEKIYKLVITESATYVVSGDIYLGNGDDYSDFEIGTGILYGYIDDIINVSGESEWELDEGIYYIMVYSSDSFTISKKA